MRVFRKKIDADALRALETRDVARTCGVSERTARSWKERGRAPAAAAKLLALAVGDMEAVAGRNWRGWSLGVDTLVSPDRQVWEPHRLGAWWIERQELPTLRVELARYRAGVPIIDRAALDRLQRAADTAQRFAQEMQSVYPAQGAPTAAGEYRPASAPTLTLPCFRNAGRLRSTNNNNGGHNDVSDTGQVRADRGARELCRGVRDALRHPHGVRDRLAPWLPVLLVLVL